MTTDVKMCDRALLNIGMKPIGTLDGDDDPSNACNLILPMVKDEVLSIYPWRFTMAKLQLSKLVLVPVNKWMNAFSLPSDRLAGPQAVYNSTEVGAVPISEFEIFQNHLYTDQDTIVVDYPAAQDVSKYPLYITNLVIYIMSARLAEILTDQTDKARIYDAIAYGSPGEKRMGGYFEICRQIDSRQNINKSVRNFALTDVRN